MKKSDLETRLIAFAVLVIDISKSLPSNIEGNILRNQIVKSGTSLALNYGEALAAESKKDFIHKIRIVLKELRETYVNMRIIQLANLAKNQETLNKGLSENNELVSIFVSSIKTAQSSNL